MWSNFRKINEDTLPLIGSSNLLIGGGKLNGWLNDLDSERSIKIFGDH